MDELVFEDYEEDVYRLFEELTVLYTKQIITPQITPKIFGLYNKLKEKVDEVEFGNKKEEKKMQETENIKINELSIGRKNVFIEGTISEIKLEGKSKMDHNYKLIAIEDDTGKCECFAFDDRIFDVWDKPSTLDKLQIGTKVNIVDAYCSKEYGGVLQLTTGRFGKVMVS